MISRTVLGAVDFEEIERLEAPPDQSLVEDNRTMTTRSRRSSKPPSAAETAAELAVMDPVKHQDTYLVRATVGDWQCGSWQWRC